MLHRRRPFCLGNNLEQNEMKKTPRISKVFEDAFMAEYQVEGFLPIIYIPNGSGVLVRFF